MSFFTKPRSNIPNNALNVNTKITPPPPPKEKKYIDFEFERNRWSNHLYNTIGFIIFVFYL